MFSQSEKKNLFLKPECAAGICRIKLHGIYLLNAKKYVQPTLDFPTVPFFKLHQTAWVIVNFLYWNMMIWLQLAFFSL